MRCIICKRMLRKKTKYELCSNCHRMCIGQMINKGIIKLEDLRKIVNKPLGETK